MEARLRVYDTVEAGANPDHAVALARLSQRSLWTKGVAATRLRANPTAVLVLPTLNEMIDISTARLVGFRTKVPVLILSLLGALAVLSAFVIGYATGMHARRSVVPALLFSLFVSSTVYAVLDLDNPQLGLVRLDAAEQQLRSLHDSIR
jgi:hypothetical protein